jgi:hypothetical protein
MRVFPLTSLSTSDGAVASAHGTGKYAAQAPSTSSIHYVTRDRQARAYGFVEGNLLARTLAISADSSLAK